ncbi:glycosyltransferase [Labilibacter sediminis]|nr:glycosyltransferase [Labilibacter sediminis]
MSLISIVIPVYNSEKFLSECLNSVVNQTLKEIEILCVNDGSTDNSLKILQYYANKDKRIVIIDKKNEGVGATRNLAFKRATGKYIFCVDSDDYISSNTCEVLYNMANKYDLDLLQVRKLKRFTKGDEKESEQAFVEDPNLQIQTGKDFNYTKFATSFACGKLWRRDFILDKEIFNTGEKNGEDQLMSFKGYLHAQRVLVINFQCYFYRIHNLSATFQKRDEDYLRDRNQIATRMINMIEENNLWNHFGFMKRLFLNMYRLNKHCVKKNCNNSEVLKKHRQFINDTRRQCKQNRESKLRFTSHIERFYLFHPVFWRFFKVS